MSTFKVLENFLKLRRNNAYKILGFLSYPIVFLFIYFFLSISSSGFGAIAVALITYAIGLLIFILFFVFNIIAFLTINKSKNYKANIFADIGYFSCCLLIISIIIGLTVIIPGKNSASEKTKIDFDIDKTLIQKFLDDVNRENKVKYNNPYFNQSSLCVSSRKNFINCFARYINSDYKVKYVVENKEFDWDKNPKLITKNKSYYFDCGYEEIYNQTIPYYCHVWITYNYGFYRPKHMLMFSTDYFNVENARKHSDLVYEIIK